MNFLKSMLCLLLCPLISCAQSGMQGVSMSGGALNASSIIFSPAAGHYGTSQSVAITGPVGTTCYYSTDGGAPNIASTQYTAPITVSVNTVLRAVCANVVVRYVNVQNAAGTATHGWKCVDPFGITYPSGITCEVGGGTVGVLSNVTESFGTPGILGASTTQPSSSHAENQVLFVYTNTGAGGTATMMAMDKIFAPSQGSTYIAENEIDMGLNDTTQSPDRLHALSLQCNQKAGTLQWEYDNQQGAWQTFIPSITDNCPIAANQYIEVRWSGHWTQPDTGCGGFGCDSYDTLTICPGTVSGGVFTPTSCTDHIVNAILESFTEPSWAAVTFLNDQIDLTNTTTSGANPTTATRTLYQENVAAGVYNTLVTSSATYTIP